MTVRPQPRASVTTHLQNSSLLIRATSQTAAARAVASLAPESPNAGRRTVTEPCGRAAGQHGSGFPSAQQLPTSLRRSRPSDHGDVLGQLGAAAFPGCIHHDVCEDAFPPHPGEVSPVSGKSLVSQQDPCPPLPPWQDRRKRAWMGATGGESQNHRMVGVGRDLYGSPSPTLLLKQGHLQQAAQDKDPRSYGSCNS